MKSALQIFCTNFENMWSKKKKLSNLLKVLLRIHLAPKREAAIQKYKKEKQQQPQPSSKKVIFLNSIPFNRISIINKSRNGKRSLFRNEEKKRKNISKSLKLINRIVSNGLENRKDVK